MHALFFLSFFVLFLSHTSFVGLRDPRILLLEVYTHLVHTFICLIRNSFISSWIPTKFVSVLLLCMLYHTNNFQHKANTSIYLRGTFALLVDNFHYLDPLQII